MESIQQGHKEVLIETLDSWLAELEFCEGEQLAFVDGRISGLLHGLWYTRLFDVSEIERFSERKTEAMNRLKLSTIV